MLIAIDVSIRDARPDEALALEALQRRSSDVWEEYRAQLAAHPDAIEPPDQAIGERRARVAIDASGAILGFRYVDVIANPIALEFYRRVGFEVSGTASTRFGSAPRMTLQLAVTARSRT